MNGITFAQFVRKLTKQNSTSLPDDDLVVYANAAKEEMCSDVEILDEAYFNMEWYRDLVAGQRFYSLPWGLMNRIQKVSLKLTAWGGKYRMAEESRLAMEQYPIDETNVAANSTDAAPKFFLNREGLYLLTSSTITDEVDGIQLFGKARPNDISAATLHSSVDLSVPPSADGVGVPERLHVLWARRTSIEFKQNQDRPIALNEKEQMFNQDLTKAIRALGGQNTVRKQAVRVPRNLGYQY